MSTTASAPSSQIEQQMRQMEAKMESMSSQASVVESDNLTGRLRDENVRLSASVAVLEERLKETESRYRRDLESERAHLESLMARSKRTYEEEIENLRGRFQKLEADLSATTAQLSKTKVELDGARAECKRTTEALIDAQDKVNALTEQLNNRSSAENWELQKAIADRDQAINALREVNTAVGGGHRSSTSLDTVARLEEMQQLILRLKQDNKRLTKQVQDAQEESWFNNLRDGQKLLYATESSVSGELDKLTKEEVVDLLTQEKHTNNVLRTYLNSLLEKVVINHPELLESRQ
uniref:FIP-RBD domain-containing protein n=1 Tax=Mesocestoides corti TaxID=53468 RepID=A0A5K3EIR9_MESCO